MDYQNTLKYLYESMPMFQQIGGKAYKPGLETTHKLDEHFGSSSSTIQRRYISPERTEKVPAPTRLRQYCNRPDIGSDYSLPLIWWTSENVSASTEK